ncbi:MAG: YihY/virulence factor BrkB family protein [Haloarculaceae archaeon]
MNRQVGGIVRVTRQTVQEVRDDRITFIAASLAYYAFVSLVPLLLLAVVAASLFGGEALALALANRATDAFGSQAGTLVQETLSNTVGGAGAGVVGTAVLLWSGLKLFRGMDVAFSTVYGAPLPDSIVDQLRNGAVTLGAVGVGIAATVAVGVALAVLNPDLVVLGFDLAGTVGTLLLVGGLTAAFLPLYYFLPGDVEVREALPGAVFAAVGWTLLQTGFRIYAASAGSYEGYGVLGAVLLLVTFLYFGGLILLVGVVLNAVLAGRVDAGGLDTQGMTDTDDTTDDTAAQRTSDESAPGAPGPGRPGDGPGPGGAGAGFDVDDIDDVREELERIYDELDRFEGRVEDRTVHREEIEGELKQYVRARLRRGKARGWGPYLVLLYGTAMTIGAFYSPFLGGGWAVLAMIVIWLSTLGLYALMLVVGAAVGAGRLPGRLADRFGAFRD